MGRYVSWSSAVGVCCGTHTTAGPCRDGAAVLVSTHAMMPGLANCGGRQSTWPHARSMPRCCQQVLVAKCVHYKQSHYTNTVRLKALSAPRCPQPT